MGAGLSLRANLIHTMHKHGWSAIGASQLRGQTCASKSLAVARIGPGTSSKPSQKLDFTPESKWHLWMPPAASSYTPMHPHTTPIPLTMPSSRPWSRRKPQSPSPEAAGFQDARKTGSSEPFPGCISPLSTFVFLLFHQGGERLLFGDIRGEHLSLRRSF